MKYLNREYGFAGRPPFSPDFKEEVDAGAELNADSFPKTATVGWGFNPQMPSYLFLQGTLGSMWGAGLQLKKSGKFVDIGDIYELCADKLTLSKGARFVRAALKEGVLQVARVAENMAVLAFIPHKKCKIKLVVQPFGSANSTLQTENGTIKGRACARGVVGGVIALKDEGSVIKNRFTALDNEGERREYFTIKAFQDPSNAEVNAQWVKLEYELLAGEAFYACAVIGDKMAALDIPTKECAAELLQNGATEAQAADEDGYGMFCDGYTKALIEVRKHLSYDPYLMSMVLVEDNREERGFFGYEGTERALGAIIAAIAGEEEAAEAMALTAATDPILGALAVLFVYRRTHKKEMIQAVLPRMMEEWELNDKLVVADLGTKREVCYKQYGSPLKEDLFHRGAMISVDMSSYKLLAFRIVALLLSELGVDQSDYVEKADGLQKNINNTLYCEELGIYRNRYVAGDWAEGYGFTSYLPMAAGAVLNGEQLNNMLVQLKNPKKFWGNALFPTLAKDNGYYGKKNFNRNGERGLRFENFSGMISPWANLLMYCGFRCTGLYDCAAELARASSQLFMAEYDRFGEYPAFYRPDGKRSSASRKHALSALVMPLLGACELLDCETSAPNALRFGTTEGGMHGVRNVVLCGKKIALKKDDAVTSLYVAGEEVLRCEPGSFEIRNFVETDQLSFLFRAPTDVKLTLKTPVFAEGITRKITFHMEAGKHQVVVREGKVEVKLIAL